MGRYPQGPGRKGSQKWLQQAVALSPALLDPPGLGPLRWLSPRADDDFAEYSDAACLDRLGLGHLAPALAAFWPRRGPQWDGLALSASGLPVLVEAKAHLAEMLSPPSAASPAALARIAAALDTTRAALGGDRRSDWTRVFYQYANRLAHLHFLHANGVAAHLLFLGFVGDDQMGGPAHAAEWQAMTRAAHHALGLAQTHPLARYVHHLCPQVQLIGQSPTSRSSFSRTPGP